MSTIHLWFRSGNYSLLGHIDAPQHKRARLGVVIVPPFGWEDVCSYRPLRFMARTFADAGIPALRYDLPGTGDSSGDARDPGLFDAWVRSVDDAATELRLHTGVEDVAAVGIHAGAMLAMMAASRYNSLQRLVLWGPAAKGRSLIRELRAAANMERWEYLPEQVAPQQAIQGFEAGGFLIAPETLAVLENLDVCAFPWLTGGRPTLLLSRDDLPHDSSLVTALQAFTSLHGVTPGFEMANGRGYSLMMAAPQESVFPAETCRRVVEFLTGFHGTRPPEASQHHAARIRRPPTTTIRPDSGCAPESIYRIETSSLGIFGILTEPPPDVSRSDHCVLFLNPGGVRHTGPNRMWVESARRWAAQGITSLRLDLQGIGESDGEQFLDVPGLYQDRLVAEIGTAMESLRRRTGLKRFTVVGLCSGACWGFHAAMRYADVRAAILVNPSLLHWDPVVDMRRILPHFGGGFTGWGAWARMVGSGIRRGGIERAVHAITERLGRAKGSGYIQPGPGTVEQTWAAFERAQKRVTLVFRDGEPLLAELAAAGQLPPETNIHARCIRLPNGGHTFRPLWAQKLLHDLIDRELAGIVRPESSHPVSQPQRTLHV